jgi:calcineurin-like phosphoesterase family protein
MNKIFAVSDNHFGHTGLYKPSKRWGDAMRPEFANVDDAEAEIIRRHNGVVKPDDTVYFLGDVTMKRGRLRLLTQMNGKKILVMGNHDCFAAFDYLKYFEDVEGFVKQKLAFLSHAPIHPNELYDRVNIHGHVHRNTIDDNRYINACLEVNNYTPIDVTKYCH